MISTYNGMRVYKDIDGNETWVPVELTEADEKEKARLWRNYLYLENGYRQGIFGKETLRQMQSKIIEWVENIKNGEGYKNKLDRIL